MPDYDDWDNRFYQDGVVTRDLEESINRVVQQDSLFDDPEEFEDYEDDWDEE